MVFKVELIKISKSYASVVLDADNRKEALAKARSMSEEEFDEIERTEQISWETKREWNFLDFLFNRT
tara:strand:- start:2932 stop:3132 length:201 start_codon:yes stop_codon:yes gene_type:complete